MIKKGNLWDTFCYPYPVGFVLAANFISLMFLVVNRFLAENSCLLWLETRSMRAVWVKRNIVGSKAKTMWQKSEVIKSRVIPFMSLDPLLIYENICLHIALNKQTCVRPLSTKWNKSSNICWLTRVQQKWHCCWKEMVMIISMSFSALWAPQTKLNWPPLLRGEDRTPQQIKPNICVVTTCGVRKHNSFFSNLVASFHKTYILYEHVFSMNI